MMDKSREIRKIDVYRERGSYSGWKNKTFNYHEILRDNKSYHREMYLPSSRMIHHR
jgi:hypothetical protein